MSLPDRTAVKNYLRIPSENTGEDSVIDSFVLSATASIEEFIGRPITAAERTFTVEARNDCPTTVMFVPLYPVEEDSVTIADADGEDVTSFRLNTTTGKLTAIDDTFDNFPYEVTATVGLDLMDDFDTRIEPKLSQAFLDLCADWYQRRNPAALAEGAGGGVITQWQTLGLPERICKQLEPYRLAKAH